MKKNQHQNRQGGGHYEGPGRRTWGDGPRVGRVARDVPKAERVGEGRDDRRERYNGSYDRRGDFRREGGHDDRRDFRREGGYGKEGDFRREDGYRKGDSFRREGGFKKGGYPKGGFDERRQGGYPKASFDERREGGYQKGGFEDRRGGDFHREGGHKKGGYPRDGFSGRREGGFDRGPRREDYESRGRRDDAPQAYRVTGEGPKKFHRGSAWRSESGPKGAPAAPVAPVAPVAPAAAPGYDYEAPEIPEELLGEFTDVEAERLLAGRNPIREALKAGRPVEKLLVAEGDLSGSGREIIRLAKAAGAVVQTVDRSRLDQICPAHQGMLAYVAAAAYVPLEDLLAQAKAGAGDPFIVVLDGVTDPHNLGAIIRSAECAGAHGVVIPERRAAGLTPAAAKAAAGALNHIPVARVKNLNRALDEMKAAGLWIIGADMGGEDAFTADLTGPVALVIGSEGDGVSHMILTRCDRTVSLPIRGHIDSLNASVAAGVLMYEIVRQRGK